MTDIRMSSFQAIPPVIKNLIIVNALVFFAQQVFENSPTFQMEPLFALHDVQSYYFRPHQIVTHMFMHGGWGHIFVNMLMLWMFGSMLENVWGSKRFLTFYMISGIGAALVHLVALYVENHPLLTEVLTASPIRQQEIFQTINSATVGASGAVFGCLAAFGYLFPNSVIYIYFLFPLKAKWFVLLYAVFELVSGVQNTAGDNVAHWAHLGGGLAGFLLVLYWNKNNRRNFY